MGVEWTGRNVEVTAPLRALAEERASRLERHLAGPVNARVVLWHEKHRYIAEVIATHRRKRWTAKEETEDARSALTVAFQKIDAQAGRDTTRQRDRKHRGTGEAASLRGSARPRGKEAADAATDSRGRTPRSSEAAGSTPRIVRVARRAAAKPMTVEEAAMRIEASHEEVVVFRDAGSEKISVLYKRRDGDFGLIVPEC